MLVPSRRRQRVSLAVFTILFVVGLFLYHMSREGSTSFVHRYGNHLHSSLRSPDLPLDYRVVNTEETSWCQERYGVRYLENARNFSVSMCGDGSQSSFTCFFSSTAKADTDSQARMDAMCYGQRAFYDASIKKFRLGCNIRILNPDETAMRVPDVPSGLPMYWYETGPKVVMERGATPEYMDRDIKKIRRRPKRNTILLKREGKDNVWHCLMEIISLTWSLDVLQISNDPGTGEPFLSARDGDDTQVVLLDDLGAGPFFELWKLFAKLPIRQITELDESEPDSNIIIPFAGGSNPLWQGDWVDLVCRDSALVKTFVSRVLNHFNISAPSRDNHKVVVTFISRTNSRRLINETAHMGALRSEVPHIQLNVVDFAAIPFQEQIKIVRETDLLAGVHGAGLTHLMFLPPGSAVLEILPEGFKHKGFRNLAQMLGLGYFRAHTMMHGEAAGDAQWQHDAVEMEQRRLVEVVNYAARSLYSKGIKDYDTIQ